MPMMIGQGDCDMGCGVACVASVLGESFQRSLRRFQSNRSVTWGDAERRGYKRRELLAVLKEAGKPYRLTRRGVSSPNELPLGTIVFCKGNFGKKRVGNSDKKVDLGHYLVRLSDGWMDSLDPSKPRKSLGKMTAVSALVPATPSSSRASTR